MVSSTITFFVNGSEVSVGNPDPELTLATFLRYKLHLTGTKLGCEEGACGSCTVAIARWSKQEQRARFVSANACITPLYLVHGALVLTVEGIGSQKRLHPIQERLSSGNATQCGFCSPGFVMAAYALLRNNPSPTAAEIRAALVGNLCRCTGYRPILEALESFAKPTGGCCMGGRGACPCKESTNENTSPSNAPELVCGLVNFEQMRPFDESSEIIFPPKLIVENEQQPFVLSGKRVTLLSPTSLEELFTTFKSLPMIDRFVSTGIMTRLEHSLNPLPTANSVWVSIQRVQELKNVMIRDGIIHIGSGLTISEFLTAIRTHCKSEQYVSIIEDLFTKYSSDQVKNMASWSGALASALHTSDFCTLFLALNWRVRLLNLSISEYRTQTADQFFSGVDGRETAMKRTEIITELLVPIHPINRIAAFKHGKRFGADDTVLNAAASFDEGTGSCRIVMGVFQRPLVLDKSSVCANLVIAKLKRGECPKDCIAAAIDADFEQFSAENEFDYKKSFAQAALSDMLSVLAGTANEGGLTMEMNKLEPLQLFKDGDPSIAPVGRPLRHAAADRHTTGEAEYVDDIRIHDCKHAALVLSTEAHARILSVDPSHALAVQGVLAYDIPSGGKLRPALSPLMMVQDDTPVFADGVVEMVGQPIGCIVAEDVQTARSAAQLVKVVYEKLPAILNIEDAIAAQSYLIPKPMQFGKSQKEVDEALQASPILLEGELEIGGQEHLCLETQSSIVVPQENDEWILHTATQNPSDAQYLCANLLGIPANNVVVKVRRLGGGFGAKATGDQIARGPAILAANKLRKPVSCVLHRYDDMVATGKRHPALFKYRVGIDEDGRLLAVHVTQYIQCGYSMDHSVLANRDHDPVCGCVLPCADHARRVLGAENKYVLKHRVQASFGRPQTFFFMETVMSQIAKRVGKTLNYVKKLNLFQEGDRALCGSTIRNYCLPECWQELEQFSDFEKLHKECEEFNKISHRVKRGVAISGTVQGLTSHWFEMGTAHVQIMLDGTVRLNVGAVEMGQGLNTKMIQIASAVLKIPHDKITIIEMATDKTANVFPTACEKLLEGIQPHIDQQPGDLVKALMSAWMAKVPLQANETVKIERAAHGMPARELTYFTTGAACVLVEVDCATGVHKLKSVDIVMDLGDSINPAIDIGQIEGAFIQGYGLMTSEEIETDETGKITNASVCGYKIPTVHMVPERFRVKLLENGKNYPGQIYRSKGIGEPPLLTATAVHSAIRMAIDSYRGNRDFQRLDSPLTAKRILNACQL